MKKKKLNLKPSTSIILRYSVVLMFTILVLISVLPILLNYPPESINTVFDVEMSYISYYQQFTIVGLLILLLVVFITKVTLRDIDLWYKDRENEKFKTKEAMDKIRKKCFNLPYIIFFCLLIIPVLGVFLVLNLTGSHFPIMIIKILILVFSFDIIFTVFTYILSKSYYNHLLIETFEQSDVQRNSCWSCKNCFFINAPSLRCGNAYHIINWIFSFCKRKRRFVV